MRQYELVLVIDPDLAGEDREKQIAKVRKIIKSLKGEIEKTDEWGKRSLKYPIRKKEAGYYFLLEIKLPEKSPAELDKKLRLEEGIMRYLLVRKEK